MKGLLLKDFLGIKGQLAVYGMIVVIWFITGMVMKNTGFIGGMLQMISVMIPLTGIAYDEKAGWDKFALAMPVSRQKMVLSKFLFMMIVVGVVAILIMIGSFIVSGDWEESVLAALFASPFGIVFNCIMLPILFLFGVEKGRFVFIGVIAAFLLFGFAMGESRFSDRLYEAMSAVSFSMENVWHVLVLFWVVAAIFLGISIIVSRKVYAGKEF